MRSVMIAVLAVWVVLLPPAAGATDTEPQVYFFWAASCPYSKSARSFLRNAQSKDPQLRIRDFEVDQSLPNTLLLGRVYEKIGMSGFWVVPLIVVGHQVIIGYIDDDTTGHEILGNVAACRKAGCKDAVRDLIGEPRLFDEASATRLPVGCVSRPPGR